MPQIQFDIPEQLDEKISLYQTYYKIKTKAEAILKMLEDYPFEIRVKK